MRSDRPVEHTGISAISRTERISFRRAVADAYFGMFRFAQHDTSCVYLIASAAVCCGGNHARTDLPAHFEPLKPRTFLVYHFRFPFAPASDVIFFAQSPACETMGAHSKAFSWQRRLSLFRLCRCRASTAAVRQYVAKFLRSRHHGRRAFAGN